MSTTPAFLIALAQNHTKSIITQQTRVQTSIVSSISVIFDYTYEYRIRNRCSKNNKYIYP